jgi:hypothetical protein
MQKRKIEGAINKSFKPQEAKRYIYIYIYISLFVSFWFLDTFVSGVLVPLYYLVPVFYYDSTSSTSASFRLVLLFSSRNLDMFAFFCFCKRLIQPLKMTRSFI